MSTTNSPDQLRIALAQISPIWLNRDASLEKVAATIGQAAKSGAQLLAFGETLVPGYPFWLEHTDAARFESSVQKDFYARYVDQAVDVGKGHLDDICALAKQHKIMIYLGCAERTAQRGQSVYCTLFCIDPHGAIVSSHRKLMPTYEERLAWAVGDGNGLRTHAIGRFTVGGLNCWENWMPLARHALQAQGEDLHIAVWPGSVRNTEDITRFIARESRSFVVSVSSLFTRAQITDDLPHAQLLRDSLPECSANGGSCVAGPDGQWLLAPVVNIEGLQMVDIDHAAVRRERQNFDPSGHYARPDVLQLQLNRARQSAIAVQNSTQCDLIDDHSQNEQTPKAR